MVTVLLECFNRFSKKVWKSSAMLPRSIMPSNIMCMLTFHAKLGISKIIAIIPTAIGFGYSGANKKRKYGRYTFYLKYTKILITVESLYTYTFTTWGLTYVAN